MKLFGKDYKDFYIEEHIEKNPCGDMVKRYYCIKFANYFFGFKYYTYFTYPEIVGKYEISNLPHCQPSVGAIMSKYRQTVATYEKNIIQKEC